MPIFRASIYQIAHSVKNKQTGGKAGGFILPHGETLQLCNLTPSKDVDMVARLMNKSPREAPGKSMLDGGYAFMKKLVIVLMLSWLIFAKISRAEEQPLWELGIGFTALHLPDYRGSDDSHGYLLPVPYIIYRGKRLRAERTSVKGQIFESDRLQLDISLGGGVPVNSDDNEARLGMPDLNPTGELGPSLEACLWKQAPLRGSLWLKLPLRGVFSVSSSDISFQGWKFAPYLHYQWKGDLTSQWWKISMALGPVFTTKKYHDFFYEVEPVYATNHRPEYHPSGGYSGSRITLTAQERFARFWVGGFVRYDNLSDAAFAESPLVKTNDYLAVGLVVSWIPFKSKTFVNREP